MRKTLFLQIFLVTALICVLGLIVFALYTLSMMEAVSFRELTGGLERAADLTRTALGQREGLDTTVLRRSITEMARQSGLRLTIIDPHGTVLADSEQDPAVMENHGQRPEVARALEGETGVAVRQSSTVNRPMVYVAVPVGEKGKVTGVVRVSYPAEQLQNSRRAFRLEMLRFALILFVVCAVCAFFLSRWLLAPLRNLTDVVQRFTAGDFGARLHLRRSDEIRNLADSFNSMAERVQTLFAELSHRTEELDGVFSSVAQGIAILDRDGRIARANRGFEEIIGQKRVEGKAIWEVARTLPLMELVDKVREQGAQPSEEVRIGERTVICSVARVAGEENLIAVLHDTTDTHRLEEVKRDFVVNASHELRTPLTAIQGFLEMLEDEVKGEAARWVAVIRRNTDRMTAIVEDLLRLSRLEGKGMELSREPVALARIFADLRGLFAGRAEAKGLDLKIAAADSLPVLESDPYLLEQMLVNLVDNAVKYTETGYIAVSGATNGPWMTIEVEDTGIGIPEGHVPRIFERFYVVDKSRSRSLGGTGLGLSIVKHIAALHGGTVTVESVIGKGTRFRVRLPIAPNRNLTEN